MSSENKGIAVVTGASAGIGAMYADRLAHRGYDLVLVARNRNKLDDIAKQVSASSGRKVDTVVADLNAPVDLDGVETLLRADPGITMLVNNAGIGAVGGLLDSNVRKMQEMIELNITALTRLTYAVVPGLVSRGGGTVINISSAVAIAPELLNGVYGATKAYVLALSLSLHKELATKNLRVQAVLPGAIATNFWDVSGGSLDALTPDMVMQPADLVDAALAGLDQGELVTIPSLPVAGDWDAYEAARQTMIPNLSRNMIPERYRRPAPV